MPEAAKRIVVGTLERRPAYLDRHLAGNDCVMGDALTVADACAYTVLNWIPA